MTSSLTPSSVKEGVPNQQSHAKYTKKQSEDPSATRYETPNGSCVR
jgi:hypothetical protein